MMLDDLKGANKGGEEAVDDEEVANMEVHEE